MGIQNLLPFLENSTRNCHVSEFRGCTIAVDSYCWLHKGARSCSEQLAKGEDTDMYVQYCMKYVKMLLHYDIKPILVFDGRRLPAKLKTEERRRENKKKAMKQANEYLRLGQLEEARRLFKQTVDINPQMALKLIRECRKINVDCIVAPYESDAQLAFFSLRGIAQCVISEDSDLLLFGCKKVMYKMDVAGHGQLVEGDKIYLSMKMKPNQYTFDKFRFMCILSGCDYVDSLHGIGLKKSLKFLAMTAETNPELFLDKVPRYLNMRHLVVDDEYKEQFLTADATFRHQLVYDPTNRKLVPLNELDVYKDKPQLCKNAGEVLDSEVALQLALGNLDPNTLKKIDNWWPSPTNPNSIWCKNFQSPKRKKFKSPVKKPPKPQCLDLNLDTSVEDLEYDIKIQKELECYKTTTTTTKIEVVEEPKPPEKSPVIQLVSKNPFAKRISGFSLTTADDETVVRSRFFCSQTDSGSAVDQETKQVSEQLTAISCEEPNSDSGIALSQLSQCSTVSSTSAGSETSCDSLSQTVVLTQESLSETFETLVSVENIPKVQNVEKNIKKRKSESQLVSKFKKIDKKQLSLKDMFTKMAAK